jgi:hypothetical protein
VVPAAWRAEVIVRDRTRDYLRAAIQTVANLLPAQAVLILRSSRSNHWRDPALHRDADQAALRR